MKENGGPDAAVHSIVDHPGIVGVEPLAGGERVEIAFDPVALNEAEVREIALTHIQPGTGSFERRVLRLDGQACEAAATRMERRVEQVPGVRKATATYVGRVLCLTFDAGITNEATVMQGVKAAGAKVKPLQRTSESSLWQRMRTGDLNEELSCGAGLLCLIAAVFVGPGSALKGIFYLGAYIFCGQYGVRSAVASLRERTLDVDVLMVLAALGAATVGAPFEGALLLFLFSFSNVLQRQALDRAQRAIESLLKLRPEEALRKRGGSTELVPLGALHPHDVVVVRPGELLPVDGLVVEGSSNVDEASLTGESFPVAKSEGSQVFAGTQNQSGALEVRLTKNPEDSTLAKMVKLVAEAQAEKSTTQRFLEKAEQRYAAGVIGFTILVMLVPWLAAGEDFASAFYRAMTVMVVASPCALIISTPATVLSAIGGAARRGILIKGGTHLETAARVDIVCLDKTGTLTTGKPTVTEIVLPTGVEQPMAGDLSEEATRCLRMCAALESKSEHPLAAAVVRAAEALHLDLPSASGFQANAGRGAVADIDDRRFMVGSERFFQESNVAGMEVLAPRVASLQAESKTCIWLGERLGEQWIAVAAFALADTLRPSAHLLAAQLRELGVKKVIMLTGDQPAVADVIARESGMDEFHAALLPADKVELIRALKREGTVIMIGDGVNDAPAMATAHLGAAMGAAGTDVAMETADVVLMGDKLENIPLLVGMARHSKRVLIQNLTFATAVILVLVAAALGFALPLPIGVIGHEGSTVLVCLNGLRLLVYSR